MSEEDEIKGVLNRWSKRKLENAKGLPQEGEEADIDAPASIKAEPAEIVGADDLEANRQAAEAIDLETIDEESDLSLFLKEGVPEVLKKAALAKLWRSSPVFANVDGLVDYDDNFADPNLIMKKFTSAYKIGKGYLKEVLEEDGIEAQSVSDTLPNNNTESPSQTEEANDEAPAAVSEAEAEPTTMDEPDTDYSEETKTEETSGETEATAPDPSDNSPSEIPTIPLRQRLGLA